MRPVSTASPSGAALTSGNVARTRPRATTVPLSIPTISGPTIPGMTDEQLLRFRSSIDNIDAALVHLLAERFKITQAVGEYKASADLPPSDPEREQAQVARLRALAEESGLDPAFTEKFLRFIVAEVIQHHERIAAEH